MGNGNWTRRFQEIRNVNLRHSQHILCGWNWLLMCWWSVKTRMGSRIGTEQETGLLVRFLVTRLLPFAWHQRLDVGPRQFWWNYYPSDLKPKPKDARCLRCSPSGMFLKALPKNPIKTEKKKKREEKRAWPSQANYVVIIHKPTKFQYANSLCPKKFDEKPTA